MPANWTEGTQSQGRWQAGSKNVVEKINLSLAGTDNIHRETGKLDKRYH